MGADYYIYTEIKRNGEWHSLNGKHYKERTGTYEITPTYTNGSRSYFSNTYNKLRDIGNIVNRPELSTETLAAEDWFSDDSDRAIVVSLTELRNAMPKNNRHEHCGYVYKEDIYNYENENEEIYDWLSPDAYMTLSEDVKKAYEFYEWNDPAGWVVHFKEIIALVNAQIQSYMQVNYLWDEPDDIRIVCLLSC